MKKFTKIKLTEDNLNLETSSLLHYQLKKDNLTITSLATWVSQIGHHSQFCSNKKENLHRLLEFEKYHKQIKDCEEKKYRNTLEIVW